MTPGGGTVRGDRPAYLALFVLLFLGWGVLSPFLPAVLAAQGASAPEIGVLLGLGVVVRLLAMPVAGRLADRLQAPRQVLAGLLAGAALCALGYWLAIGFLPLLLVGVLHAVATGPMGPLPDALAVRRRPGGWITAWCAGPARRPSFWRMPWPAGRPGRRVRRWCCWE